MAQTNQLSIRPGQMTAVMRAVAASGPKVLRIGVVQNGHVVEERIIQERVDVTVGPSEKSIFVLPSDDLKVTHTLFRVSGDSYVFQYLDGMSGRVALATGVGDLEQLKGQAKRARQGVYEITLTEDSRGKVIVGDTTFLFQFVAPPPLQPKPQLPVAVTGGASGIDWTTTIIAAFVFFAHFMFIGSLYSSWLDPIVDEQISLEGLVETLDRIPQPPAPKAEPEEASPDENAALEEAPKEAAPKKASPKAPARPAPGQSVSKETQNFLADKAVKLKMRLLAVRGGAGAAFGQVLRDGDTPLGSLDSQARADASIGSGGTLDVSGASGPIARSGGSGLSGLVKNETTVAKGSGKKAKTKGPVARGNTRASGQVAAGKLNNAARVVAQMNGCFRGAYNSALQSNPDISGKVALMIKVGASGAVTSVSSSGVSGLPSSLVSRLVACARRRKFDKPSGGSALLRVPVSLVKQ